MATITEINDNKKWYQAYVLINGAHAADNFFDATNNMTDASSNPRIKFKHAKWCISGSDTKVILYYEGNSDHTFLVLGESSDRLVLDIPNNASSPDGNVGLTITGTAPSGWMIVTFEKVSGFTDIDAAYHSTEYPSIPNLP